MRQDGFILVETICIEGDIDYSGSELRSHFIRENAGIKGDGVVSFTGRCHVEGKMLVDLEDAERGNRIVAHRMLHFIGEHFSCSLREGNLRLRVFTSIVKEVLEGLDTRMKIARKGDDLFIDGRKLTVAICTASPTSILFHFGINIDPAGAPVPAVGLDELGIDAVSLARSVMDRYRTECESIEWALRKVRGVS